jgi:serine/threonine-protein kinase
MLEDASKRLGYYSLIWAGLVASWLTVNNFVAPVLSPSVPLNDAFPIPANPVGGILIVVSVALFLYTQWHACDCQLSLDLGLLYEVALAFGIGLVNQWTPDTTGLSWIVVVILLHPMIVPNTPGRIVAAALVAASMDPLGLLIAGLRGETMPSFAMATWAFLPNYICAFLAVMAARIFTRLGEQVQDARELGSYRLGKVLGRGGMGEIYEAKHRMLRRPAAVKLIRHDTLHRGGESAETVIARFKREAHAAASLHSPHTIALYDFGVTNDGNFYYVMEFLRGIDLERLVEEFGPLPEARVVHLLAQACDSLAEAHAHGLVHRDIKPANLYTCRVGIEPDFVKVLDFGLVKTTSQATEDQTKLTAAEFTTGTPAYMPPELALGDDVDPRADIYSIGCVAYWLLTGNIVFEGDTPMKVMLAHINEAPERPSVVTETRISPALEEIVLSCLAKERADRPATARELSALLLASIGGTPWTTLDAERWWSTNLPDFGPPTVGVPGAD